MAALHRRLVALAASAAVIGGAITGARAMADHPARHRSPSGPHHLVVRRATVDQPVDGHTAAVRLAIVNPTAWPDRLVGVSAQVADQVTIHVNDRDAAGRTVMRPVRELAVPAHRTLYFAPGLRHVMLDGLRQHLTIGEHVELVLRFERRGTRVITATVEPIPTN